MRRIMRRIMMRRRTGLRTMTRCSLLPQDLSTGPESGGFDINTKPSLIVFAENSDDEEQVRPGTSKHHHHRHPPHLRHSLGYHACWVG
jgi:hypothetical protein